MVKEVKDVGLETIIVKDETETKKQMHESSLFDNSSDGSDNE